MNKTLRQHSKENATSEGISIEIIVAGSLQRIADSMDVIAKDRVQLEKDLKWYMDQHAARGRHIQALESQIKGLKIAKSRFKNQLDNLTPHRQG